jgi:hypothetical protein
VSPGPVDTEFATSSNLNDNKDWEKIYSAMPKLKSEDVADAVIYVLSTPPHVQVSYKLKCIFSNAELSGSRSYVTSSRGASLTDNSFFQKYH